MDLGVLKFHCKGGNALHGAVHESHGAVWTEGRSIFLAPISLFQGQIENREPSKLGEFDRGVRSVHWSGAVVGDLCYMCVVHERNISVWKVAGKQPSLVFKQVRKINIQPLPHGIAWCPGRDVLCVLCPQQASLYYSHVTNKGSQVLLQIDSGKVRCGCWTTDGSQLIIAVDSSFMIYQWSDIDGAVTSYTARQWTIPGLTSQICSVFPVSDTRIICSTELPLDNLCKPRDSFLLPDLLNSNSNAPIKGSLEEGEIIRPRTEQASITETLFNLPRSPDPACTDSARLEVVDIPRDGDPATVTSCDIPGVITPGLLLYQAGGVILVGSHSQPLLQIYSLIDLSLQKTGEILLDKTERPQGLVTAPSSCCNIDEGVLILIGRRGQADSAFLSADTYTSMKSVLKFFNVKQGHYTKHPLTHTTSTPSIPVSVATNGNHDNKDYDKIYESVMNFGPRLKNGENNGDIRSENNNSVHKPLTKSCSVVVSRQSQGEQEHVKVNGSYRNSFHGDFDMKAREKPVVISDNIPEEEDTSMPKVNGNHRHSVHEINVDKTISKNGIERIPEESAPVPPKRPLRKKKSMRGKDDMAHTLSNSSLERSRAGSGVSGNMPMEYMSDSSEFSPRDSKDRSDSTSSVTAGPVVRISDNGQAQVEMNEKESGERSRSGSTSNNSNSSESLIVSAGGILSSNMQLQNEVLNGDLKLPSNGVAKSVGIVEIGSERGTTEDLEVESVDFNSQQTNFRSAGLDKFCGEESGRQAAVMGQLHDRLQADRDGGEQETRNEHIREACQGEDRGSNLLGGGASQRLSSSMESLEDIDRILKEQNEKISKLHEQMSKLSRRVDESSCILTSRYASSKNAEMVQLCFRCSDGYRIEKRFLLDNGRLKYEPVRQAFSLDTVEIIFDDEPCVVGSNIDGYIPLRFEAGTTIYVSGKPAV
ncbi:uncharacterized protein LOC128238606 isoform X2 [Mya arenaria]|uniref:uncharacterized protein LOC128238606 isoform X2 n=1 Tax=Mya arenaria TaxID=6604 RepID=UPI0022E346F7|nr:uncharacterized protein LOC128238606 isoform X2 [Mya arenaria]